MRVVIQQPRVLNMRKRFGRLGTFWLKYSPYAVYQDKISELERQWQDRLFQLQMQFNQAMKNSQLEHYNQRLQEMRNFLNQYNSLLLELRQLKQDLANLKNQSVEQHYTDLLKERKQQQISQQTQAVSTPVVKPAVSKPSSSVSRAPKVGIGNMTISVPTVPQVSTPVVKPPEINVKAEPPKVEPVKRKSKRKSSSRRHHKTRRSSSHHRSSSSSRHIESLREYYKKVNPKVEVKPTPTPGVSKIVDKSTGKTLGYHDSNRKQSVVHNIFTEARYERPVSESKPKSQPKTYTYSVPKPTNMSVRPDLARLFGW